MAYPYEIVNEADALPTTAGGAGRPVFRSPSTIYKVLRRGTNPNFYIAVHKSTDDGVTWAEVDSANHPASASFEYATLSQFDDGTRIWIAFLPAGSPPTESNVIAFNTTSDEWEAAITGGPMAALTTSGGTVNGDSQLGLAVRSNGDKILVHSASPVTLGPTQYNTLKFAVYSGGSWGAAVNLLIPGTTESGQYYDYALVGVALGNDGARVHVFAFTPQTNGGYAYITILANNSTANYRRWDNTTLDFGGNRDGIYGEASRVEIGGNSFAALPHGILTQVGGVSATYKPCLLLVEDSDSPGAGRVDVIEDAFKLGANWESVCVAFDSSTGAVYLMWTKFPGNPASDYKTQLRIACFKGFGWSAPSTLFESGTNELIETMEISAAGGVMRAAFSNSAGNNPYHKPHYYQSAVTCAAAGCPATVARGNINSVR